MSRTMSTKKTKKKKVKKSLDPLGGPASVSSTPQGSKSTAKTGKFRKFSSKKAKKKKVKTTSLAPSAGPSCVSTTPQGSSSMGKDSAASESSGMCKKAQCDLCKLSYSTEKELTEHLLSILHHTKMEDKEEKPVHICTLCSVTCFNMADYRVHVTNDTHQEKLSRLKGDGDENNRNNNKGKQPSWKKQQKHGYQSKYGVSKGYKKRFSTFNEPKKFQGLGFNSQGQYDDSKFLPALNAGHLSGNTAYQYPNRANHWSQEQFSEQRHHGWSSGMNNVRNISENRSIFVTPSGSRYLKAWGSSAFGFSHQYRAEETSSPWKIDRRPQKLGMNFVNQREHPKQPNNSSLMNIACSATAEAWDEQSFLQHEEFLASMDDVHFPGQRHSPQRHSSSNANIERQRDSRVQDRKLPKGVDDHQIQDTFANKSRSSNVSPVIDVHRRYQVSCVSSKRNLNTTAQEQYLGITSQIPGKNAFSFQQKHQSYKSIPNNSGKLRCSFDSGSVSDQQPTISTPLNMKYFRNVSTESVAPALLQNSSRNTLDDIKKSIEKSVLDDKKEPQTKNVLVSKTDRKRCLSDSAGPAATNENKDVMSGKPESKRVCKPPLTKDSIKKIINAPNSRDERLRLARILQSRGEHKTAAPNTLRTSVQLQGLHDSAIISQDVNLGGKQNSSVQTIKLEDLSDGIRHQILSLIGNDVGSFVGNQSELEVSKMTTKNHTAKKPKDSNADVILLSDDEDVIITTRHENNSQKCSSSSTSEELKKNAAKKKKVMKVPGPASKNQLYRSALPSGNQALSEASSIKHSENREPTRLTEMLTKKQEGVLSVGMNVNITSRSSSSELSKNKKLSGKKSFEDSMKTQVKNGKTSESTSLCSEGTLSGSRTELSVDKTGGRLKDFVAAKKLQTCVKSPHIRKNIVKTLTTDDSSEISSTSQSAKVTLHDASCHTPDVPVVSSSVQRNLKSSTQHALIQVKPASKDALKKSLSPQVEIVSSSLHTDTMVRSSTPDTGSDTSLTLTAQQHNSAATTLSVVSSPNSALSHTQTPHRLTLPPSSWLRGRTSPSEESLASSSLNASTSDNTSGVVTVVTDDEDDNGAGSKQVPDRNVNDLTQPAGASEKARISSSERFDNSHMLSSSESSLPFSLFKDEDKPKMDITIIDDSDNSGVGSEQLPDSAVGNSTLLPDSAVGNSTLLPDSAVSNSTLSLSTLQRDIVFSPDICENNHSSTESALPNLSKDVKVEVTSQMVTTVTDDEDSSGAVDKQLPDSGMDKEASADATAESSSNIMSELLILSEREEDIKQEKMSLDLRLSRLHKLLEQAVLQINKCTERRQQLHEEEKELSGQRLSLLREAAALNPHKKPSAADVNNIAAAGSCDSEERSQASSASQSVMQNLAPNKSSVPCASVAETSVVGSSTNENPQGASLSRDDWLAKFASYLPCDRGGEDTRLAAAKTFLPASSSTLTEVFHCSSIPTASLSSLLPIDAHAKEGGTHPSQIADYVKQTAQKLILKPATDPSLLLASQECHSAKSKSDGSLQFPDDGSGQSSSTDSLLSRLLPKNVTIAPFKYLLSIRRTEAVEGENVQIGSHSE